WRRLVYLALFFGLALVALGSWYSYDEFRSDRALQEAIAEADRLDTGWRLEEIEGKRAMVPDTEKSALCVLRVIKLLKSSQSAESTEAHEKAFNLSTDISRLSPEAQLTEAQTGELRAMLEKAAVPLREARRLKDLPAGRYHLEWPFLSGLTYLPSQNVR